MDIETIVRDRLIALRKRHYASTADFARKSGIHYANVRSVEMEGSTSLPGILNLSRWVRACGLSLAEFFSDIENIERGGKPKPEHQLLTEARALIVRAPDQADVLAGLLPSLSQKPPLAASPASKKKRA